MQINEPGCVPMELIYTQAATYGPEFEDPCYRPCQTLHPYFTEEFEATSGHDLRKVTKLGKYRAGCQTHVSLPAKPCA